MTTQVRVALVALALVQLLGAWAAYRTAHELRRLAEVVVIHGRLLRGEAGPAPCGPPSVPPSRGGGA